MAEAAVSNNPDVQYFQKLLNDRKIRLPKDVLTQEAVERSRNPDVMEDAALIKRALNNWEIDFCKIPRLACGEVKNALYIMADRNAREITEMIFLKSFSGGGGADWPDHEHLMETKRECLEFFKQKILPEVGEEKIQNQQVKYREKAKMVEFGFLKGKVDFLATITDSSIQEIIILCKGTKEIMEGKLFSKPSEGHQAKLIKNHPYYYQTLSYKYILQNLLKANPDPDPDPDPDPVQVVMVLKHQSGDNHPEFYWNHVEGDLEKIHQLNEFCTEEALPRFLALLQLMDQPGPSSSSVEISDDEDE